MATIGSFASSCVSIAATRSIPPVTVSLCPSTGLRGIRCAQSMTEAIGALGLEIRIGLHCGECEVRGDDLTGLAVHIAARVGALAGPGEVLVSGTVKDLVAGSGIRFEEHGEHELRGVPGSWKLFAARG